MKPIQTNVFWLPKAGNSDAEYEDAYFTGKWKAQPASESGAQDAAPPPRMGIAIADGATEGMLSGLWANLLVRRFVRQLPGSQELDGWLAETLGAWKHKKRDYLLQRERSNKPVQWYEEPGLEAGAFAALLGLVLEPAETESTGSAQALTWKAVAIGDCFLAQVRERQWIRMFPYDESSALNNRPYLLASNPARNRDIAGRFVTASADAIPGDRFYLMTDALAGWFLRSYEKGAAPWRELNTFCGADAAVGFAEWVAQLRTAHEMRNDDVTCIHFEL